MELSQDEISALFRAVQEREAAILRAQNKYLRELLLPCVEELEDEQDRIRTSEIDRLAKDPREWLKATREYLKQKGAEESQQEGSDG